ncbi:hypothetical protein [Nonomuraea sp. NPDC023979]|uniref:hypothetical protein n=1 Tax=Nonomuraea sp. NPDC023979 TaxID=3154796 RepID=UPI0033F1E1DD
MSWLPGGERYTRLPIEAIHELLEKWHPRGVRSMDPDDTFVTITSATRCSESAEPCDPPCGLWWVEFRAGDPDEGNVYGKHLRDDDWLPVPVQRLPSAVAQRSVGDHGYWQ